MMVRGLLPWEAVSFTMPVEISMLWPILWITGQENPSPFEIYEALSRGPVFNKFFSVYKHSVIIVQ